MIAMADRREIARCPHCDSPLPHVDLDDVDAGRFSVLGADGQWRVLCFHEFLVFEIMLKRLGKCVARETFMDLIYGKDLDPPDDKIMDIWIMRIRKKLKGTAYRVDTQRGFGWRLERGQ